LGLALAGKWRLRIWSRTESAAQAASSQLRAEFASADPAAVAAGADAIVLCSPVEAMPGLALAIADSLGPETFVTDAGSVKGPVVEKLEAILGNRFVGSHPMAGSEKRGLAAARADLFQGAACIVPPMEQTPPAALEKVESLWLEADCRIFQLTPAEHDAAVACLSHLPHAVACCLVETLPTRKPDWHKLAGSS